MSKDALTPQAVAASRECTAPQQLRYAKEIVELEGKALLELAARLNADFCQATRLIFQCRGSVIVTGMGKAGLIAQKVAATLASTGTHAHFLHPAEAVHGDLGRIHAGDVVLALSKSGETEEMLRLLPSLRRLQSPLIVITASAQCTLARAATVVLCLGPLQEACSLGLAPSTSTTAMLALCDALALVTSRMRNFGSDDFYSLHPAGNLGRQLSHVEDHMRPLAECRVARDSQSVRQVYVARSQPGRRSGAIMLTTEDGRLSGLFTDSDLARLFESRRDSALDGPIRNVMTPNPATVQHGAMMSDAVEILAERKISELPVVGQAGQPLGLIDITDVVGMIPEVAPAGPAGLATSPPHPIKAPKMLRLSNHDTRRLPRPS